MSYIEKNCSDCTNKGEFTCYMCENKDMYNLEKIHQKSEIEELKDEIKELKNNLKKMKTKK